MIDTMTTRERLIAALHGQPVDRVPFSPFLAYVWDSYPTSIRERGQLAFLQEVGADPLWRGAPCPVRWVRTQVEVRTTEVGDETHTEFVTPVGAVRLRYRRSEDGNTGFLVEHPLKTVEDFHTQIWIEEHTTCDVHLDPVDEHFARDGREGLSVGMLVGRGKTAFQQLVEYYVGTEELAYALADFPEVVEELHAAMMARNLEDARLAAEVGPYDYYLTWEDSSTQNYSPALYERYIAPEIRAYCDLLRPMGKHYIQHACGHVRALLPTMRACGVLAVESLSSPPTGNVEMAEARALLGDTGIIGGIEPTHLLTLSDDALDMYVEQVIADCAGGPFVLANSDSCPPGVTPERFRRVADLARRLTSA